MMSLVYFADDRSRRRNRMKYSVWVGGVEVNDSYLTKDAAAAVAEEYSNNGYDDVQIEEVSK